MRNSRAFNLRSAVLLAFAVLLFQGSAARAQNGVMMQYFHWYNATADNLWLRVVDQADDLAAAGFTALWLPPATKANGGSTDVGYAPYDLYDLGEFNQKGSVRTKYGSKSEYLQAIQAAHANNLQVYGDLVLNHKGGADATEWVQATRVQTFDRNQEYGGDVSIQAWTDFEFPGRGTTYSPFKWHWVHFDGVDWAQNLQESGKIYKFRGIGKAWDTEVDTENGNYDYLMFADLDMDHPDVRAELKTWGTWYVNTTGVDGLRFDAVKHIQFTFFNEFLDTVRNATGKPLVSVGEYWKYDVTKLNNFITKTNGRMALFDAPLHLNFYNASRGGGGYDMRNLLTGTLMQANPALAVTLVENHDTQPLQALESPVESWFKPLAYAFILLRQEGLPCVFYADYYGAQYTDKGTTITLPSLKTALDKLLSARKQFAYGPQYNYLDHQDVIGWTRLGDAQHPRAMAAILTDGPGGAKWMEVGKANARFTDWTGNRADAVTTNEFGWGQFPVNGGSVSVWVQDPIVPNQVSVFFTCNNGYTVTGQDVYVTGSIAALGSWDTSKAVKLSPMNYPTWSDSIAGLPSNTQVQWKCLKKQGTTVVWQEGANNVFTTPLTGSTTASGSF
jgi:alpha-amylase